LSSFSSLLRVCSEKSVSPPQPRTRDAIFIIQSAAKAAFRTPWLRIGFVVQDERGSMRAASQPPGLRLSATRSCAAAAGSVN
jgi:hypothetical protein